MTWRDGSLYLNAKGRQTVLIVFRKILGLGSDYTEDYSLGDAGMTMASKKRKTTLHNEKKERRSSETFGRKRATDNLTGEEASLTLKM